MTGSNRMPRWSSRSRWRPRMNRSHAVPRPTRTSRWRFRMKRGQTVPRSTRTSQRMKRSSQWIPRMITRNLWMIPKKFIKVPDMKAQGPEGPAGWCQWVGQWQEQEKKGCHCHQTERETGRAREEGKEGKEQQGRSRKAVEASKWLAPFH